MFDPNNILIHVTQNFVNFIAGTIAWMIFIPLGSQASGREGRGLEEGWDWVGWLEGHSHQLPWAFRFVITT